MKLVKPLKNMPVPSGYFGPRESWEYKPGWWTLPFHYAVDLPAPEGTPVYAMHDGTVTKASWDTTPYDGGNEIQLTYGPGFWTWYLHLSGYNVAVGAKIKAGDVIGYVGSTGASTGPHLHPEIHLGGNAVDPYPYLYEGKSIPDKYLKKAPTPAPKPSGEQLVLKEPWYIYRTANDAQIMHSPFGPTPAGTYLVSHYYNGVPHITTLAGAAIGWVHPSVLGKTPEPVKPKPAPVKDERITIPTPWYIYKTAADAEAMRNWSQNPIPAGTYKITHWAGKTPHFATLAGAPLGWVHHSVIG